MVFVFASKLLIEERPKKAKKHCHMLINYLIYCQSPLYFYLSSFITVIIHENFNESLSNSSAIVRLKICLLIYHKNKSQLLKKYFTNHLRHFLHRKRPFYSYDQRFISKWANRISCLLKYTAFQISMPLWRQQFKSKLNYQIVFCKTTV